MKYDLLYQRETSNLLRYYANKNSPVKRYIQVCQQHISELESVKPEEDEYLYLFQYVLISVKETYRPDQFISVVDGRMLRVLDIDFMQYFLNVRDKLTSDVEWDLLCRLNANYAIWKMAWLIEKRDVTNPNRSDRFLEVAIKEVRLKELYKYCTPDENISLKSLQN